MRWVLGVGAGLALTWLALIVGLALARPEGTTLADAARLLPDLVGLVQRLARDPEVPRGARVTLWLLAGYLVFPVDLVPDFLPVIGYADDAIVVAIALRRVVRVAGLPALERHWRGTPAGMAIVRRLAGT
ncbi:MAG TPA: YkvA family protein [Acidimicrobiales bacterium]|nr:YkvA family protein [Acidimicrobiales bacterium]